MKLTKFFISFMAIGFFAACQMPSTNQNTNLGINTTANTNSNTSAAQNLREVPRPQKISDMSRERGEQETAAPVLKVAAPTSGATVNSSIVKVKLELTGDLKGYKTMKDPATGMGNHIHVILDNQPYEAYYNLDQEFELRNVADGEHTLRVFPSRPWHESYKTDGAFQIVRFTVKNGGADVSKPTTTDSNQTMSNANANSSAANANTSPEGKDVQSSMAGAVDFAKPLLTYSRPKGEYKGADSEAIMIDFWLSNAKLVGDGGEYRVRYSINNGEAKYIDKWQPVWLSGWADGKHTVKLELVDQNGNLVDNGGYNSTTREITVVR